MGYFKPGVGDVEGIVGGRELRYVLTWRLRECGQPATIAELVEWCQSVEIRLCGRPSKVISDALRWEIAWGRVERVGRGVYQYRGMPVSTQQWVAKRVSATLAHTRWAARERARDNMGISAGSETGESIAPLWGPEVTTPPDSGREMMPPLLGPTRY